MEHIERQQSEQSEHRTVFPHTLSSRRIHAYDRVAVPNIATNQPPHIRQLVQIVLHIPVQSRDRHPALHGEGVAIPEVQELRPIADDELASRFVIRDAPTLVIRRRRLVFELAQFSKSPRAVYEAGALPPAEHDQTTVAIRVPVIRRTLPEVSIVHVHGEFHLESDGVDPSHLRLSVQTRRFVHLSIVAIRQTLPVGMADDANIAARKELEVGGGGSRGKSNAAQTPIDRIMDNTPEFRGSTHTKLVPSCFTRSRTLNFFADEVCCCRRCLLLLMG